MHGSYSIERQAPEEEYAIRKVWLVAHRRPKELGVWEWNLRTREYDWSANMYRIFNLPPQEFPLRTGTFLSSIHPEDRQKVVRALGRALVGKEPYSIDHRIVWPDGSVRLIHGEAAVTFDQTGRPLSMLGTVQDVTGRLPADQGPR
jgi:PAS domain-containing protein